MQCLEEDCEKKCSFEKKIWKNVVFRRGLGKMQFPKGDWENTVFIRGTLICTSAEPCLGLWCGMLCRWYCKIGQHLHNLCWSNMWMIWSVSLLYYLESTKGVSTQQTSHKNTRQT